MVTMSAMAHNLDRTSPEVSKRPSIHLPWLGSPEAYNQLAHSADNLENVGIDKRYLIAEM